MKDKSEKAKQKEQMYIEYVPEAIRIEVIEVCGFLNTAVEKYSVRHMLSYLRAIAVFEGMAKCNMLAMLMSKKEADKVLENIEAGHALYYLMRNWDHCVKEGQKQMEEKMKDNKGGIGHGH